MDLLEIMRKRRSVRKYTQEQISEENLERVLQAGLMSATGKSLRPWELVVVRDRETLEYLSECRVGAAKMLKAADAAIVLLGNPKRSDVWIEDCSVVMANMHLMASTLGMGSCWIQGRLRQAEEMSTEAYVREKLRFPEDYRLEAILSLGMAAAMPKEHELEKLPMEKVHREIF